MHVVVIGAGIVGVTSAYFLRQRGHEVTVIERNPGVAQEASFANAGVVAPGYVGPWAQPGMPTRLLRYLFRRDAPVSLRPRFDRGYWRWLALWLGECRAERFARNKARMVRLAHYSQAQMRALSEKYNIDYEQAPGYLQLFRTEREIVEREPLRQFLKDAGIAHQWLDAAQCRDKESTLAAGTALAGGLHLPEDETGNCAYFARRLKDICEGDGVQFRFGVAVNGFSASGDRVNEVLTSRGSIAADAVVLAAGADSASLMTQLGLQLPLYPVKGYSATASVTRHEMAPRLSVMDETYRVAITRMGNRLRIAGTAELGSRALKLRTAPLRTLMRVAQDWFPGAAAYGSAQYWVGARPMLPDGPPVLGRARQANVFLNVGHGSSGWAMACGSARVVADVVEGRTPEIDLDGLTFDRFRTGRHA